MRPEIAPGAVFPDYELSDHTAKRRKLSELQGQDPMIVVLSRGSYCPKDRREAEGLVELHREMEVGYCRLVTISTDNIIETNEFRTGVGAHWPFLSDPRRIVQKDLDIAEYTDPEHDPMIPHVIVLEPGTRYLQDLQRVLVLRSTDSRRAPSGSARRQREMPAGLGHNHARAEGCMAAGPQGALLSLRQDLGPNSRRTELASRRIKKTKSGRPKLTRQGALTLSNPGGLQWGRSKPPTKSTIVAAASLAPRL